jgi:hypothetical protein
MRSVTRLRMMKLEFQDRHIDGLAEQAQPSTPYQATWKTNLARISSLMKNLPYHEGILTKSSHLFARLYVITCWLLAAASVHHGIFLLSSSLVVLFPDGPAGLSKCRPRCPGYTRFTVLSSDACRALVERVEPRRRPYHSEQIGLSFHPLKFRGSTVSLTLESTNQICLFLIGRMRIPDQSDGMVWLPACPLQYIYVEIRPLS